MSGVFHYKGKNYTSEAPGMSGEYAIGTAAKLDMSRIEKRICPGLVDVMMDEARTVVASLPRPITKYVGGVGACKHDFLLSDVKTVQIKISVSPSSDGSMYMNETGQLTYKPFRRIFADVANECGVSQGLDDITFIKHTIIKGIKRITDVQLSSAFGSDILVYLHATATYDNFRHVIVNSRDVQSRKLDLDRIRLQIRNPNEWGDKLENSIAYRIPDVGYVRLGGVKLQRKKLDPKTGEMKGRNSVQFYFTIPTLLSVLGVADLWAFCPEFKDGNHFVDNSLFNI